MATTYDSLHYWRPQQKVPVTVRIIDTDSSRWFLDDESMLVVRLPRDERPFHPITSYHDVGAPQAFVFCHDYAESLGGATFNRLCVHLDQESLHRSGFHRRIGSGTIRRDTHPGQHLGDPEMVENCDLYIHP